MPPKMCSDEDGDTPPCGVMDDFCCVERWEKYKDEKYKDSKRKAPCSCRHYYGKIPEIHKCYIPPNDTLLKRTIYWIRNKFRTI